MAPSFRVLVLDTAGRLDRELASLAAYVDDARDLLRSDVRGSLVVQAVARVVVVGQLLRQQALLASVDAKNEPIEIHERVLRARMNIVVRALYALKQNERWISRDALVGRFGSLRDFNVYVVDCVARIHTRWLEQRGAQQLLDAGRRALAYAALDEAEIALERVGLDAAVQRFLRVGSTNACEAVAMACRELAATVGVALSDPSDGACAMCATKGSADRTAS